MMNFVHALNEIHTNVWAVLLIVLGIIAECCHAPNIATSLITGGFALLRGSSSSVNSVDGSVGTKVEVKV